MQRDDDGADGFLDLIRIVGIGDQKLLQAKGDGHRGVDLAERLGLAACQGPLHVGEQFVHLLRGA